MHQAWSERNQEFNWHMGVLYTYISYEWWVENIVEKEDSVA